MPVFSINYADTINTNSADAYQTRLIYFDIYTQPTGIYQPLTVEIVAPESATGSGIPAATICKAQVYYVGKNALCTQSAIINADYSGSVSYLSR